MSQEFQPVAIRDRIEVLDVVRGFALLGIALMNVEFFNRPIADLDAGMPAGITACTIEPGRVRTSITRQKAAGVQGSP